MNIHPLKNVSLKTNKNLGNPPPGVFAAPNPKKTTKREPPCFALALASAFILATQASALGSDEEDMDGCLRRSVDGSVGYNGYITYYTYKQGIYWCYNPFINYSTRVTSTSRLKPKKKTPFIGRWNNPLILPIYHFFFGGVSGWWEDETWHDISGCNRHLKWRFRNRDSGN